ncbi:hypothetical protein BD324DRAFT_80651 [Kockovaella imperatae]|uniref:DUF7729 domain-containing protein n=1 Tax=Kockovaella imperatae TaxID=4999 RepID=A0A1Y1UCL6_9TREE|nr:hypothetical protein BD324DRAFT_80651 [Kockovaella imperatae]ORX35798.1 hypothetical protein BD324DRAFT_80651 [Kockovaella imperatae]
MRWRTWTGPRTRCIDLFLLTTWSFAVAKQTDHAVLDLNGTTTTTSTSIPLPLPPLIAPLTPPTPTPIPMDLFLSYSVSTPCLSYMTSTLSSPLFSSCLPFSLLLTTSTSFANLVKSSLKTRNLTTLNDLLAYTTSPQPSIDTCVSFFQSTLSDLSSDSHCGNDLKDARVLAVEFADGLANYNLMRKAAGLVSEETIGSHCYLEAITATSADDLYFWSLPAGIRLPASSTPSCSPCSLRLLELYAQSTASSSSSLNTTIIQSAIDRVNGACGASLPAMAVSASVTGSTSPSIVYNQLWLLLLHASLFSCFWVLVAST